MKKLHLGCGAIILPGWDNLDLHPGIGGIICDLTKALPYEESSVDVAFTEHFMEHLTREQGVALLKEVKRVLKPHGILRIITPDLAIVVQDYCEGKTDRTKEVWQADTPCQAINGSMRLWEHKFLYDHDELALCLTEAGFSRQYICSLPYKRSGNAQLNGIDQRPHHEEIILEAAKV